MKIVDISIGKRFRQDVGDLKELTNSIKNIGLLHPVVVDKKNNLIAGYRRLLAYKEIDEKEIPVTIIDIENILQGEYDENAIRKNFTPSEAVAIWEAMESYQGQLRSNLPRSEQRREVAAKVTNVSTRTLSKAKQVVDSGDKKLIDMMDRTGNVNKSYRYIKQKKDEQRILKEQPTLEAQERYKTIVIDPPWQYDTNVIGRTIPEYATMDEKKLAELKIPADQNSHLYIWTTNAFIPKAIVLGIHWGFEYKTCITWIKPSIGIGSYFRNSTEHCLFFVKGHLSTRVKNIPTHFEANRTKHSEKPDNFYSIIEKASYPPYLEIFGRKERKNWKVLGNL